MKRCDYLLEFTKTVAMLQSNYVIHSLNKQEKKRENSEKAKQGGWNVSRMVSSWVIGFFGSVCECYYASLSKLQCDIVCFGIDLY